MASLLGFDVPIATHEEFMGRNSKVDAGTWHHEDEEEGTSPLPEPWDKILGIIHND